MPFSETSPCRESQKTTISFGCASSHARTFGAPHDARYHVPFLVCSTVHPLCTPEQVYRYTPRFANRLGWWLLGLARTRADLAQVVERGVVGLAAVQAVPVVVELLSLREQRAEVNEPTSSPRGHSRLRITQCEVDFDIELEESQESK